ncbi:MAG: DNA polymerase III subunit gamma/tau, partial [Egibacteraceae bacterium]
MAYVSLYRKYRPQTFADVVGQAHVTTTLGQAVAEDRVHHAYLFTGPRGTGKTSTARILAKSLNCERGPTAEPCNTCTHCVAITAGSSVDVIEIDAASHGRVEDVRDLRDRVAFAPVSARTKVYIVDECHMLSTAGWNAFLKTVEEPPGHVVFVFATTEPHKVLDTILSRTQRFDFKRVGAADLAGHVRALGAEEGMEFEPGAVELVARAGDGSVRDTLSVLDQVVAFTGGRVTAEGVADVLGAVPEELLVEMVDHVAAGDVAGLCVLVGRLADAGHDLRQFTREAVDHLRALFVLQAAPDAGLVEATPERLARMTAQAGRLGQADLLRAVELLAEAQAQMRRGSIRLPLELALAKAAMPEAAGDPAALAARMDRLERRTGVAQPAETPQHHAAAPPAETGNDHAASAPAQAQEQRAPATAAETRDEQA